MVKSCRILPSILQLLPYKNDHFAERITFVKCLMTSLACKTLTPPHDIALFKGHLPIRCVQTLGNCNCNVLVLVINYIFKVMESNL